MPAVGNRQWGLCIDLWGDGVGDAAAADDGDADDDDADADDDDDDDDDDADDDDDDDDDNDVDDGDKRFIEQTQNCPKCQVICQSLMSPDHQLYSYHWNHDHGQWSLL